MGPNTNDPYRRHPRPEAIFLFVGPYSKSKEGVTRCLRVKEEVGPIQINLYRRHPRQYFYLWVPIVKNKEEEGSTLPEG